LTHSAELTVIIDLKSTAEGEAEEVIANICEEIGVNNIARDLLKCAILNSILPAKSFALTNSRGATVKLSLSEYAVPYVVGGTDQFEIVYPVKTLLSAFLASFDYSRMLSSGAPEWIEENDRAFSIFNGSGGLDKWAQCYRNFERGLGKPAPSKPYTIPDSTMGSLLDGLNDILDGVNLSSADFIFAEQMFYFICLSTIVHGMAHIQLNHLLICEILDDVRDRSRKEMIENGIEIEADAVAEARMIDAARLYSYDLSHALLQHGHRGSFLFGFSEGQSISYFTFYALFLRISDLLRTSWFFGCKFDAPLKDVALAQKWSRRRFFFNYKEGRVQQYAPFGEGTAEFVFAHNAGQYAIETDFYTILSNIDEKVASVPASPSFYENRMMEVHPPYNLSGGALAAFKDFRLQSGLF